VTKIWTSPKSAEGGWDVKKAAEAYHAQGEQGADAEDNSISPTDIERRRNSHLR